MMFEIGTRVKWQGEDAEGEQDLWTGTVIGIGIEGVTVEFEDDFSGHSGVEFTVNNQNLAHSPRKKAWYFDYKSDKEAMSKVEELIVIEEPK